MIVLHAQAPDFTLPNQHGTSISLRDYRGAYVLLIFYPRDNSLVCTKQLCNYRDNWEEFNKRNIVVLGINPAPPDTHKQFAEHYNFPFSLLSDTDGIVSKQYGSTGFLGITKRSYVLVHPQGTVVYSAQEYTQLTRKSTYKLLDIFDALPQKQHT